jgi:hypothetical protein
MAPPHGAIERRKAAAELHRAFTAYTWSVRDRRRVFGTDLSDRQRDRIRAEFRALHGQLDRAYRPVRELFVQFVGEEPRYDLRHEVFEDRGDDLPVDAPLTRWSDALTFDEAFDTWADVDDDQIEDLLERQEAVLDAFESWAGVKRSPAGAEPPTSAPAEAPPPKPGTLARVLNNPWTITVGGGTLVVAIATLAVKLL